MAEQIPKKKARATVTLRDPSNVDSELSADDVIRTPTMPGEDEIALARLVDERYNSAADNRRIHEPAWFESLAFYLGNQWVSWSNAHGILRSMRDPRRPHQVYAVRNKIRPKIKKLLARGLSASPDAGVAPLTASDLDRAAAAEARALIEHLDNIWRRPHQVKRLARFALTTSTAFLKIYWDPDRRAEVPKFDAAGAIVGSSTAAIGDICEDIAPIFEIYLDPKAREWEDVAWLIHAKVRSLEELRAKYGDRALDIEGDAGGGVGGYVESRLASVVGEYGRGSEPGQSQKSVLVKELWEKPTLRFPEGRLITVAGGRVLRDDPWPYAKKDDFPFVPLSFEDGQSTVYGLNAVSDLISAQRSYNEGISRTIEHRKTAWGKILAQEGSEIGVDAFDSAAPGEVIYYKQGSVPPQHIPAPPLPPFLLQMLQMDEGDMNDISGVHEVSEGGVPAGVTAASAIQQLLESDTTQMADFIENIETWHQRRAEWEIALAAQFYKEPRLVWVSEGTGAGPHPALKRHPLPILGEDLDAPRPPVGEQAIGAGGGGSLPNGLASPDSLGRAMGAGNGGAPLASSPPPPPADGWLAPVMQARSFGRPDGGEDPAGRAGVHESGHGLRDDAPGADGCAGDREGVAARSRASGGNAAAACG
ncbi:hypothetical protein CCAX7_55300 [Capsulimonas corticalis]|uniref:Uncharacterized protein n=1 Tax=Capsulimonas corticalis TaxID=2219043 RepID=A0A402D5T3_9BACT|nr:hypothetical protein [Capsulimonas corticalis]BDI33479.1 hypothetical protein CCAX7_55300 [Capsulimonas corticalis]